MEDDQKIARLLQILFENHGYEVKIARDGEEGWQLFHFFDPLVVVLDLMLPGMDGFEVLEKIRSIDEEVGIVVLTARGEVENRIRGLKRVQTTTSPSHSTWMSYSHVWRALPEG